MNRFLFICLISCRITIEIDAYGAGEMSLSLLRKVTSVIPDPHSPEAFAILLAGMKTGAADIIAQKLASNNNQKKKEISTTNGEKGIISSSSSFQFDKKRFLTFVLYGGMYLGWFQHFLFTKIYTRLFPLAAVFAKQTLKEKIRNWSGAFAVIQQVSFEAFLHWPWLYIPMYYVIQQLVTIMSSSTNMNIGTIQRLVSEKLRQNWKEDLFFCWGFWVPCSLINFSTMPLNYQAPFTAFAGLFYMSYFSFRRGGSSSSGAAAAAKTE